MFHANQPPNFSDPRAHFAREIVETLRSRGFDALWAGGCVRDQLLGKTPKDYDVATNARPEQIRGVFGRRRTLLVGAAFGVVTVLPHQPSLGQVEVATFRRDGNYTDGRHPDQVSFSDPREDAQRRDFTINGLFYDPIEKRVIDYVGGEEDLGRRVIRCIGDPHQRFDEDKLRMIRAVRFATTLGFEIEPETRQAIQQRADEVRVVSAERIAAEMRRTLVHENSAAGLSEIRQLELWRQVLPEYANEVSSTRDQHWMSLIHLFEHLDSGWSFATALAALLWPLAHQRNAEQSVAQLTERWKLANVESKDAHWLLTHVTTILHAQRIAWPTLQSVLIDPRVGELLRLTRAIIRTTQGPHANMDALQYCEERLAWPAAQLNPAPLLNGNDLRTVGIPAGPELGRLLTAVRHAQLDGLLDDRETALAWVARQRSDDRGES